MNKRRDFLKKIIEFSALSVVPISLNAETSKDDLNLKDYKRNDNLYKDENFWTILRQQFPLDSKRIYLNNGTMGPSPFPVIDAVTKKMMYVDSTGEYGGWEDSRKSIAKFVNVDAEEICLTHNVTEGINIICWGLDLKKDDEIIITNHEHAGGALPWLNRAKLHGLNVKFFNLGITAEETLTNLKKKITTKTTIIAIPHIVCTIGQIKPIKEIIKLAKKLNIKVFVDGAHGTGMLDLDLKDLDCDYYASCCHKWLCGPKGTAFLYIKKDAQDTIQPYFVGAGSDNGWNIIEPPSPKINGYTNSAHRFDFGTQNAALWQGVNAAINFMETISMKLVESRVKYLATTLQNELINLKNSNLVMLTSTEEISRGAIIAFKLKNLEYQNFQTEANNANFRIRVVPENGVNGIRVSTHIYNSLDEINKFIKFVDEMSKK